ncbi:cupin domain-containing protein [Salmonella enterica subsp. enterica serovar Corvallis]
MDFRTREHVIVLEGALQLRLGDEWHTVSAGESLRFHADIPHAYANPGKAIVTGG